MIALVAAFAGLPAGARPSAKTAPSPSDVAKIKQLIRRNAGNTEIVSFADRRQPPVRVVRGKPPLSRALRVDGSSETILFAARQRTAVRILRGAPVVAGGSVATTGVPVQPPIRDTVQAVMFTSRIDHAVTVLRGWVPKVPADGEPPAVAASPYLDLFPAAQGADLDRVAFAVDGAESSHGADPGMWRPDVNGPQGPMQVSAAAASDLGGGDRFDLMQNRRLGRAYLARLFQRYGNWPDAVAAYNWGPGNMDAWIAQGRPVMELPLEVERYRVRVLRDGGVWQGPGVPPSPSSWPLFVP
jgi:hypothetical protein